MKILFDVSQVRTGGGIQTALALFRNVLKHKPFQFRMVCSFELGGEMQEHDLFDAEHMRALPECTSSIGRFRQPGKLLPEQEAQYKPDLVFTLFGPAYWAAKAPHLVGYAMPHYIYPEYRPVQNVGLFQRISQSILYDLQARLRISSIKKAQYVVVETETVRERLVRILGLDGERIFVVRNSYSPQFKENLKEDTGHREPQRVRQIFIPTSYYPHKNLEVVSAVAAILKKRLSFPFRFVFTLDQTSWAPLYKGAEELGVTAEMTTAGKVFNRDIAGMYQNSDMVFLPTLLECSTAVYPESFMSRRPVVTSSLDFARELCGPAALYCDPYSPEDCALQIQKVLEDDHLSRSLVEAGDQQLLKVYPNPEEKWQAQLSLILSLVKS